MPVTVLPSPAQNVSVINFPATQQVAGNVGISNFPSAFQVSNFPATQQVSGTVNIGNLPTTQQIAGTVSVSNLPATQPISAQSLPLPAGAARDSTLLEIRNRLPSALQNNRMRVDVSGQMLLVQSQEQYYASPAGGCVSYGACSGAVTVTSNVNAFAMFLNPADSGVDVYLARTVLAVSQGGWVERYRNPTIEAHGTAKSNINRAGRNKTGKARLYDGTQARASGGTLGKVLYLSSNGFDESIEEGAIILPPGGSMGWWLTSNIGAGSLASIEITWWELPYQG